MSKKNETSKMDKDAIEGAEMEIVLKEDVDAGILAARQEEAEKIHETEMLSWTPAKATEELRARDRFHVSEMLSWILTGILALYHQLGAGAYNAAITALQCYRKDADGFKQWDSIVAESRGWSAVTVLLRIIRAVDQIATYGKERRADVCKQLATSRDEWQAIVSALEYMARQKPVLTLDDVTIGDMAAIFAVTPESGKLTGEDAWRIGVKSQDKEEVKTRRTEIQNKAKESAWTAGFDTLLETLQPVGTEHGKCTHEQTVRLLASVLGTSQGFVKALLSALSTVPETVKVGEDYNAVCRKVAITWANVQGFNLSKDNRARTIADAEKREKVA